jgi:hypothetical protein
VVPGFRVAQLRAIFSLPDSFGVPEPLVYLELFTSPHGDNPIANIGMYRVRRAEQGGTRCAQVVPLSLIYRSVHLLPMFGSRTSAWNWEPTNVLETCNVFYVNQYVDTHSFGLLF